MKSLTSYRKRLAGFSLVELAIVLLISGILMSAGLSLLTVKRSAAQLDITQKHQEAIKQALISYLGKNRRLPCPATTATGAEDRTGTTSSPCKQYSGIVPYQTLGLDRSVALDGWENFITYVVSQSLNPNTLPTVTPPYTTAWVKTFSTNDTNIYTTKTTAPYPLPNGCLYPTYCAAGNLAFWPSTSTGGIKVIDGTNTIADPSQATGAAVVLISYGKNGYGAFNPKGQNSQPPALDTYEIQNAASAVATTGVIKRDATDSTTAGGGPFDDVVMILSANDLTGPLIANGTLQSSAQAALSQANDIVMGAIVNSSQSCNNNPCSCNNSNNNNACNYYYTLPQVQTTNNLLANSPTIAAWGVNYSTSNPVPTINISTTSPSTAYTLIADDGATRTVSMAELKGILTRGAGF